MKWPWSHLPPPGSTKRVTKVLDQKQVNVPAHSTNTKYSITLKSKGVISNTFCWNLKWIGN